MSNIQKLYKQWYKQNKRKFFCKRKLKESQIINAKQSLLDFLRINNVSIVDADIALAESSYVWELAMDVASLVVGYVAGCISPQISIDSLLSTPPRVAAFSILIGIVVLYMLRRKIHKTARNDALSREHLLQMTLQEYKEMYKNDLYEMKKLIPLSHGALVRVPLNAIEIYDNQANNTQCYDYALLISSKEKEVNFCYIWYTNTNYKMNKHAYNRFVEICKKQTGKCWTMSSICNVTCESLPQQQLTKISPA